jgi:hypothetical protein
MATTIAGTSVLVTGASRGIGRALVQEIPPSHRAGVMSAFCIAAYAALSVPAVLAGLLARPLGLESTFELLGSMDAALALVVPAQRGARAPALRRAPPSSGQRRVELHAQSRSTPLAIRAPPESNRPAFTSRRASS